MSAAWKEYVPLPCYRNCVQGAQGYTVTLSRASEASCKTAPECNVGCEIFRDASITLQKQDTELIMNRTCPGRNCLLSMAKSRAQVSIQLRWPS